jgi:hypothetical protein
MKLPPRCPDSHPARGLNSGVPRLGIHTPAPAGQRTAAAAFNFDGGTLLFHDLRAVNAHFQRAKQEAQASDRECDQMTKMAQLVSPCTVHRC